MGENIKQKNKEENTLDNKVEENKILDEAGLEENKSSDDKVTADEIPSNNAAGKREKKKKEKKKKESRKKKEKENNHADNTEAVRMVTNAIDAYIRAGSNCIAFTSYLDKQGKTYTVREVGKALAKANYKTLIIDCNIMAPTLSKEKPAETAETIKGFLDFIESDKQNVGKMTHSEVIPYIGGPVAENLYFIPIRQKIAGEYSRYIRRDEVENLFHILKDKFEVVLVEAPSFENLSYTQAILEASDGYFILLKSGSLEKKQIHMIKERTNQIATKSIGIIFNKPDHK